MCDNWWASLLLKGPGGRASDVMRTGPIESRVNQRTEAVTMRGSGWSDRRTELPLPSARADGPSLRDLLDVEAAFGGGRGQLEGGIIVQVRRVAVEIERDFGCARPGVHRSPDSCAIGAHLFSTCLHAFGRSTHSRRLERFSPRRRGWHDHQAHREARCGSEVLPVAGAHNPPHGPLAVAADLSRHQECRFCHPHV